MNLFDKTLKQQSELLLNKENYAYILVVLFSGLPFISWVALTIIAFVTLRKGSEAGLKILSVGIFTACLMQFVISKGQVLAIDKALLTFAPVYLSAWILRATSRWSDVIVAILVVASAIIVYLYYFPPDLLFKMYQFFLTLMQEYKNTGPQIKEWLSNKDEVIAYILGIQALVLVLSTLSILMLARALQARLFYPQGFKQEMMNIRVHPIVLVVVVCMLLGFYFKQPIFLSLLPIWLAYLVASGISVLVNLFAANTALLIFLLLLILLFLLPIFTLALFVGVGALDTILNFRALVKKGNFPNRSS